MLTSPGPHAHQPWAACNPCLAGPTYSTWGQKPLADLTHEMLVKGTWREAVFKPLNFNAAGKPPTGGALHPLMKVRSMFREIFFEMGFEEMKTNKFIESSFWNFDALYQPQQHPARDEHDTFFMKTPAKTLTVPEEYMARVKATHERGGNDLGEEYASGSTGWGYDWSEEVTRSQLLRTHTTAVSSRTLYDLAQVAKARGESIKPQKYFSIDRVFRNEALDATHLAEFHQVALSLTPTLALALALTLTPTSRRMSLTPPSATLACVTLT